MLFPLSSILFKKSKKKKKKKKSSLHIQNTKVQKTLCENMKITGTLIRKQSFAPPLLT